MAVSLKINKMNKNKDMWSNPLFILVVILLVLIVVLAIFRSVSPYLTLGFGVNAHIGDLKGSFELEAFDNSASGSDQPVFAMYYADWCGHCKRAKPHFEKLMSNYQGNVQVMPINAEAPEKKALVASQKIQGFPTIRYYPSGMAGNYTEYTGDRNYSDFVQYLGSVSGVLDKAPDMAAPVM